jgi:hypothetical protein
MKRKNKEMSESSTSPMVTLSKHPSSSSSSLPLPQKSQQQLAPVSSSSASSLIPISSNSLLSSSSSFSSAAQTALMNFPVVLFQAFNGGDLSKVKELLLEQATIDCGLKTPSLDVEIYGRTYLIDFFQAFSDAHPDAVWVAKRTKYTDLAPALGELTCRIYFAGTRIYKASLMSGMTDSLSLGMAHSNSLHSDHLYKKGGNASLLDEMDISNLTHYEIGAMRELEKRGKNLSIFGKGTMKLICNEFKKITHMYISWTITSFKEADI